ncbi:CatB-related O-acetyltransferase [Enterococcus faecium]|uniref:CatB-related O-acetyltransferase n=1 Tax=Enterococcus faecium TaxID=1352 RepID=UPI000667F901|nr:CatB-related O-acetyltransferase [Enterococcus faecium]
MNKIKKACFRAFRILSGKKGVYGNLGTGNRFTKGVFIEEGACIGKFNYFGPYSMVNNARIGNYCSFAPNVKVGPGEHSINHVTTYQKISSKINGFRLSQNPAVIKNDVWCGANVVVMQGVTIGNGAVIGANAVVTHDIPDYAIAVGIPAKVIRYRFKEESIEKIIRSNWFEEDFEEACSILLELEKGLSQ